MVMGTMRAPIAKTQMAIRRPVHIRNDIESGPAGKQFQVEDPDGNPIGLFKPAPSRG